MRQRVMVVGGGLAGVSCVRALWEAGVRASDVTVVARGDGGGSSWAPGALMHPLPGSSLEPGEGVMAAYEVAAARIEQWRAWWPECVTRAPMLRPIMPGRRGARYLSTYERGGAAYSARLAHEVLTRGEALARCGLLSAEVEGAIMYGPAYAVALGEVMERERAALVALGVDWRAEEMERLEWMASGVWRSPSLSGEWGAVVLAVGAGLGAWFPEMGVGVNGGELVVMRPTAGVALECLMSGGGHVGELPDGSWVCGATYLRPREGYEDKAHTLEAFTRDDALAIEAIRGALAPCVPALGDASATPVTGVWRGLRAVHGTDKVPLVGEVPGAWRGLYVMGCLGSKGLLWSGLAARELVAHMTRGEAIRGQLSVARVGRTAWRSARISVVE